MYGLFVPLNEKNGITIINAFQKVLGKFRGKPNKIWLYKDSEF